MAFVKTTYKDNQTVITAAQMNAIQDAILDNAKNIPTDQHITSLAERAAAGLLADNSAGVSSVPSYWKGALDAGVEAINTALCAAGRNKAAFLFYTDVHWNYGSKVSPSLLAYLYQRTGMTRTIFGGDIINDEATGYDTMSYLWDWRRQIKGLPNHHSVPGNHDDGNTTDNLLSEEYVYGYLIGPEETPDMVMGDGLYYYVDSPAERTRYLFLDTGYKDLAALSDAQAAFITSALKGAPAGWHIVVVAHVWFVPDYDQYSVRPIPIAGLSSTAASVAAILDNYNARAGEFAGCGARVECCIGGHVHRDYVGLTTGGIPIIVTETDSQHVRSDLTFTEGTTTEAAVSGVIADFAADTLTVVRVGRGTSFVVDLATGATTDTPDNPDPEPEPEPDPGPAFTNVLATVGYQTGYRLNSSGKATARADRSISGFIEAGVGDTLYFKNIQAQGSDYGRNIAHYTAAREDAFITGKSYLIEDSVATFWPDGSLRSYIVGEEGTTWVRFCFVGITDESIITVNEPIE